MPTSMSRLAHIAAAIVAPCVAIAQIANGSPSDSTSFIPLITAIRNAADQNQDEGGAAPGETIRIEGPALVPTNDFELIIEIGFPVYDPDHPSVPLTEWVAPKKRSKTAIDAVVTKNAVAGPVLLRWGWLGENWTYSNRGSLFPCFRRSGSRRRPGGLQTVRGDRHSSDPARRAVHQQPQGDPFQRQR